MHKPPGCEGAGRASLMPLSLRLYLGAASVMKFIAPHVLRARLRRGKEDSRRWREKLAIPGEPRPKGRLIWCHGVGLGEVLALRGLIEAISRRDPECSFLITSSSRLSSGVIADNLPPRAIHQLMTLDAPAYCRRFLDHWRPDLAVFSEQDILPAAIVAGHQRAIPLAWINARISPKSLRRRMRIAGLYRAIIGRFFVVSPHDKAIARRIQVLCPRPVESAVSLKATCVALAHKEAELTRIKAALAGRRVWVAASTHASDEREAIAAQATIDDRLLILVPRFPDRAGEVARALQHANLRFAQRSRGEIPSRSEAVWLADSVGELGLWYRLAEAALIGGGFDDVGGHNPWEAVALGVPVLFGPDAGNFIDDYAQLRAARGAKCVAPGVLRAALDAPDLRQMAQNATGLLQSNRAGLDRLVDSLLAPLDIPSGTVGASG